jgi:hypothetical protein
MIALSQEQRKRLESSLAVDVTDSQTSAQFVVLRKDVYDRIQPLFYDDTGWSEDELRLQLARSAQENGWEELGMEVYSRYDEELRKRCPSNEVM